jgi:hypothetical protein
VLVRLYGVLAIIIHVHNAIDLRNSFSIFMFPNNNPERKCSDEDIEDGGFGHLINHKIELDSLSFLLLDDHRRLKEDVEDGVQGATIMSTLM